MTPEPYYVDEVVTLYHGDCREVLPALGVTADVVVTDPPYGETSLDWDRWPDGWPALIAPMARQMWCFGSMRMFLDRRDDFGGWQLAQDVVWEKQDGSGFQADRFRRVHEHVTHWYRGQWRDLHHEAQRETWGGRVRSRGRRSTAVNRAAHTGAIGPGSWTDDGTRLVKSVIWAKNLRGRALNETEKPPGILAPLVLYSCPPGGLVLDPFAGSGSTLDTARALGRRAIGIEMRESQCEKAAQRLANVPMFAWDAS